MGQILPQVNFIDRMFRIGKINTLSGLPSKTHFLPRNPISHFPMAEKIPGDNPKTTKGFTLKKFFFYGFLVTICVVGIWLVVNLTGDGHSIRISRETTYVTTPGSKTPDRVDYVEFMNSKLAAGIDTDNNAVVLFLPLIESHNGWKSKVLAELGIDSLPEPSQPFAGFEKTVEQLVKKRLDRIPDDGKTDLDLLESDLKARYMTAVNRPWTEKDFPELAEWLKSQEENIAMISQGAARKKYYCPFVRMDSSDSLSSTILPVSAACVEFSKALVARALFRLGKGDQVGCRNDLLTNRMLAHHQMTQPAFVHKIIAGSILNNGQAAEIAMAADPGTSAEFLREYLQKIGPADPALTDIQNNLEFNRLMTLDIASNLARNELPAHEMPMVLPIDNAEKYSLLASLGNSLINWNLVLETINEYYDTVEQSVGGSIHARSLQSLEESFKSQSTEFNRLVEPGSMFWSIAGGRAPKGRMIGKCIVYSWQVRVETLNDVVQIRIQEQLLRCHLACHLYRKLNGSFPDRLDEVSNVHSVATTDPIFLHKFIYRFDNGQPHIHSPGKNGVDDGGVMRHEDQRADDYRLILEPR